MPWRRRALGQMATAGSIGALGDALVQRYERPGMTLAEYDHQRSLRLVAYRVPHAPVVDAIWRRFDQYAIALKLVGGRAVAFKVVADQVCCNPLFTVLFFLSQSALEGLSFNQACERTRQGFVPTALAGIEIFRGIEKFPKLPYLTKRTHPAAHTLGINRLTPLCRASRAGCSGAATLPVARRYAWRTWSHSSSVSDQCRARTTPASPPSSRRSAW
jgi:hypothetical protein